MSALERFLSSNYSYENFRDFINETFPHNNIKASNQTPLDSGKIIESYSQICDDIALSTDTLGVYAFKTTSSNASAKITLHKEIAHILKMHEASAILACFYEPKSEQFRLSLITKSFDYEANKLTFSHPKRQSFVLGRGVAIKTAHDQLSKLQEDLKTNKSLENLESAFSLEPVTKEFYEGYKKIYDEITQILQSDNSCRAILQNYENLPLEKAIPAFSKKLLGRIVFLYFLQKKGWLGVAIDTKYGSGDKNFMRTLFSRAQSEDKSFYNDFLCPLFFESLNTKRENDYAPIFDCKIPFLNGGLFEDDIHAKDSKKAHFIIAQALNNDLFERILDFFNLYNFTIEES